MKRHLIAIAKWTLCVIAAIGLACVGILNDWRDETIFAAFFFGGILIALVLGLFDIKNIPAIDRHLSIKHGARSMRRAA
jgi:hypothetical protein